MKFHVFLILRCKKTIFLLQYRIIFLVKAVTNYYLFIQYEVNAKTNISHAYFNREKTYNANNKDNGDQRKSIQPNQSNWNLSLVKKKILK